MAPWLSRHKARSAGFIYLLIALGLVAISRLQARNNLPPDFLDRTSDGRQPVARALVAASRETADTGWISYLTDPNASLITYTPFIYHTDGDSIPANATLHLQANKGREANVYLSFIIDNYEFLPEYTVFIHGHESAWHQENGLLMTLQMLNFRAVEEDQYVNLRCDWYPSCPAELRPLTHDGIPWGASAYIRDTEEAIADAWPDLFPGMEIPYTISSQCCAQFAVTRKAIRRRRREEYIRMRDWLLKTPLHDDVSGRVFEKLWAYIFTNEAIHCPPPPVCACKYFGYCDPNRKWMMPPIPVQQG